MFQYRCRTAGDNSVLSCILHQDGRMLSMTLEQKERRLEELLKSMAPVIVAFSGGVDSSYLAYKANEVLGQQALAVTAESPSVPSQQRRMAAEIVSRFGLNHKTVYSRELERPEYSSNPSNRCYYCKDELFTIL